VNKKYVLTQESITLWSGEKLFRIKALIDINPLVKAGDLGGYINAESNLGVYGKAWVYGDAQVFGDARVYGDAQVYGEARVFDKAWVYGKARVYGDAQVYGEAWVYGKARVYGDAQVFGDARVYGDAQVYGEARVFGDAQVYGEARVYGEAWVYGKARVYGDAQVYGEARVFGDAQVYGEARVFDKAWVQFGMLTTSIYLDFKTYIASSLNVYPIKGLYYLYKRVNKISGGEYRALFDGKTIYRNGKITRTKDFDPNINISCSRGIHASTPFYFKGQGNALIVVSIKPADIITCQEGKVRCKAVTTICEVS